MRSASAACPGNRRQSDSPETQPAHISMQEPGEEHLSAGTRGQSTKFQEDARTMERNACQ